jgi:hypothetical protein
MLVHCPGTPGHGSLLLPDTAGEKVRVIIDRFMDFREQEKNKLDSDPDLFVGDVTSVNLTQLKVIMTDILYKHSFKFSGYESLSYNIRQASEHKMGKIILFCSKMNFHMCLGFTVRS